MPSWKEAATLLLIRPLAGRVKRPAIRNQLKLGSGTGLLTKVQSVQDQHDYEIYVGIRNAGSKFFANNLAFPGGAVEPEDFDYKRWREVLKMPHEAVSVPGNCMRVNLPIYKNHNASTSEIDPRVAFRLCAIRELAEETGMLLSERIPGLPINDHFSNPPTFADCFLELGRLPSLNKLFDWRCWLTPKPLGSGGGSSRRYDTIFYMAFIDDEENQLIKLPRTIDEELLSRKWSTVPELMLMFLSGKLLLPPPQLHELATLLRYPKYVDLHQFVTEKMAMDKLQRILPIRANFAGADAPMTTVLPGDSDYPTTAFGVDVDALEFTDTFYENCAKTKLLHRVCWWPGGGGKPVPSLICNMDSFETGQLAPFCEFSNHALLSHL